ncbi:MAG: hypothetical protein K0U86_23600 [Planctomycetes bacterium]|nr:hypothetical protein [Planctomycetota bacterium]MCH9727898.1 hypothetical protein [Planctomycetota bacterium]MCH9778333.1 hypothetical protein [Planctomycetota bacterium]MCH9792899.1 hypothetical protein [Planctomycetota bacterium]MDF1742479.1 hypothetical protein [Gimesia sp.]
MSGEKIPINRNLVGVISIVCFLMAGYLYKFVTVEQFEQQELATGAFMRVGLLMFAFWLALPGKNRQAAWANVPPWFFAVLVLVIVGVAMRPKVAIPLILVFAFFGFFLRPRNKKRSPRR